LFLFSPKMITPVRCILRIVIVKILTENFGKKNKASLEYMILEDFR